jgi:hypothetical protein
MLNGRQSILRSNRRVCFYAEHGLALLVGILGLLLNTSALHKVEASTWPLAMFFPLIGVGLMRMAVHWGAK